MTQSPGPVPGRQPHGTAAAAAGTGLLQEQQALSFRRSSANTLTPLSSFTPDMDKQSLRCGLRQQVHALMAAGIASSL